MTASLELPEAFSPQERLNALDSLLGIAKGSDLTLDQIKTERLARQITHPT
jgi:hypothetical protein